MSGLTILICGSKPWSNATQVHARLDRAWMQSAGNLVIIFDSKTGPGRSITEWRRMHDPLPAVHDLGRSTAELRVPMASALINEATKRRRHVEAVYFDVRDEPVEPIMKELRFLRLQVEVVKGDKGDGRPRDYRSPAAKSKGERRIRTSERNLLCFRCHKDAQGCKCPEKAQLDKYRRGRKAKRRGPRS